MCCFHARERVLFRERVFGEIPGERKRLKKEEETRLECWMKMGFFYLEFEEEEDN